MRRKLLGLIGVISAVCLWGILQFGSVSANQVATIGESQIHIFSSGYPGFGPCPGSETYDYVVGNSCPSLPGDQHLGSILVNPNNYPNAIFRFETSFRVFAGRTLCIRLYDATSGTDVVGSEICRTNPDPTKTLPLRVRTGPLTLALGSHEYAVQAKNDNPDPLLGSGSIWDARMIAR